MWDLTIHLLLGPSVLTDARSLRSLSLTDVGSHNPPPSGPTSSMYLDFLLDGQKKRMENKNKEDLNLDPRSNVEFELRTIKRIR